MAFHYTNSLREVIADICDSLEEFRHIDLDQVLVVFKSARQASVHGVYADCLPLRFEGGSEETVRNGRRYRSQKAYRNGKEVLYVVAVMLPRFHDSQDYEDKLATLVHELYHISPRFNGDLRRFRGKNFAHGESRESYHEAMRGLTDRYLAVSPKAESFDFLREPFPSLFERHGGIMGDRIQKPRLYVVPGTEPLPPRAGPPELEDPPRFPRLRATRAPAAALSPVAAPPPVAPGAVPPWLEELVRRVPPSMLAQVLAEGGLPVPPAALTPAFGAVHSHDGPGAAQEPRTPGPVAASPGPPAGLARPGGPTPPLPVVPAPDRAARGSSAGNIGLPPPMADRPAPQSPGRRPSAPPPGRTAAPPVHPHLPGLDSTLPAPAPPPSNKKKQQPGHGKGRKR